MSPSATSAVEQDLDVDLVVGAVDAGDVVDRVGVDPPPLSGPPLSAYSIRPRWVKPRLPPSPTTRQRSSRAVDPDRVVGLVADVGVGLGRGLDVGADAAVPEQVDRRLQDRADQVVGRELVGLDARAPRWTWAESAIDLALRGKTPPPGEISDAS